jgi:hypothetical protein
MVIPLFSLDIIMATYLSQNKPNRKLILVVISLMLLTPIIVSADRNDANETTTIIDTDDYETESIYTSNGKIVEVWIEGIEGVSGSTAHPIDIYIITTSQLFDHFCGGEGNQFADEFNPLYQKEGLTTSDLPFHFTYTVESDDSLYLMLDNCDNQRTSDYKDDVNTVKVTFAIDDETDELAEDIGDAAAGLGIMMLLGIGACCVLPFSILIFVIVRKKKPAEVIIQTQPMIQQPVAPMTGPTGPTPQMAGVPDGSGYEWLDYQGQKYWRMAGSFSNWALHE